MRLGSVHQDAVLSSLKGECLGYLCNHGSPRGNEMLRSLAMPSACLFTSPQTTELVTYSAGALLHFRVPAYDITGHVDQ